VLETAIRDEEYGRYRRALERLAARDRQLIVARIELQWNYDEIARTLGMPTPDAVRVAVSRALRRLKAAVRRLN
jgi:DNA-directed RNA polymerase specialized sigma24 family protein